MRRFLFVLTAAVCFLGAPGPTRADEVVLKNGSVFSGRIVKEANGRIEFELEDGMTLILQRAEIERVVRTDPATDPTPPEDGPDPLPHVTPKDPPKSDERRPAAPPHTGDPGFFGRSPGEDWESRFALYPEITASKTTRVYAYDLLERHPLNLDATDPRYEKLVKAHGHGGLLAIWEFQYTSRYELRYGDKVKFVGEITSPEGDDAPVLIRLHEGPTIRADRMVVLLVKRGHDVERIATTATFGATDFRTAEVGKLENAELPVRTWSAEYVPIQTAWLTPGESDFLKDLRSPFGNSIRIRLDRYRYRVAWFRMAKEERPPLNPELLALNRLKPLAREGDPHATEEQIRRMWGNLELAQKKLAQIEQNVSQDLSRVGVTGGRSYYLEMDRIGTLGRHGITIRTLRMHLNEELLDELTGR